MGRDDREKLSFSELDRLRRERRRGGASEERRPRGPAAEARSRQATSAYLKEVDKLFSDAKGGAEGEALATAVRDAHGTPGLAAACRGYREALGMPEDAGLLSLFLDADDREIVIAALQGLAAGRRAGRLEISRSVKSRLRVLAQDRDDDVAFEAEELLALP
jgi:hypothetical protein